MSIDSLSNALKATDLTRAPRNKNRAVKAVQLENESAHASKVNIVKAGGPEIFEQAASFNQYSSTQTGVTLNEKSAIEAYQSVAKESQREGIQLLLGVDTFV